MNEPAAESFRPSATWEVLQQRAQLMRRIRAYFDSLGFLEVETPILSSDIVVDRHLDPFSTVLADDPRHPALGHTLWMQTSPEFHMKRMMAAGGEAIYQVARVFRNGETGRLHNPEFTMIEWYRRGDDLVRGMQLLADLVAHCCDFLPAKHLTYSDAFQQTFPIDPLEATPAELREVAKCAGIPYPESLSLTDRDAWLDVLWTDKVEPTLGIDCPTIVYNYPASQAALAKLSDRDPRVAERFELYIAGIELANGYHELLDAEVLLARNEKANSERALDGKPLLPQHSKLIDAMRHGLPACAGVALGFDRLLMVALGAASINEVLAFPIDRA